MKNSPEFGRGAVAGFRSRRRRVDAAALFGGEPPALLFDDEQMVLKNISASGSGAFASDRDTGDDALEVSRLGVLRLMQHGEEIFCGAARIARTENQSGGTFAGLALESDEFDLADLQRRNFAAIMRALPGAQAQSLTQGDNGFLRADRKPSESLFGFENLNAELDRVSERFSRGDIIGGMADGREVLLKARADFGPRWRDEAVDEIRRHELATFAHRCPLTRRSFNRPRGYPGDAPLLDQIYGLGEAVLWPHPATIGGQVSFFVVHSSACWAVRLRREILAREIDRTCAGVEGGARILSVACGHLRELELAERVRDGGLKTFYALDQDGESIKEVRDSFPDLPIETVEGSVRGIISKKTTFEDIDFAYAAGLLDYLVAPVAMRLIERMFSFLKPGGCLLVANFTPAGEDIGYMEAFMDWWLIYRTSDELRELLSGLPGDEVANIEIYEDMRGVVTYAVVEKA
ncbi:MAG: hypothetical protein KDD85_10710 [Parvularculaceae bacterium]|nr:hypothetical protein [Parvularculaceae bacterium]